MPFNIVLVAPEIPQNTGNIIRLCANTGARLYLVEPLGFELTEHALRRAALDYSHMVNVEVFKNFDDALEAIGESRIFATTSGGDTSYVDVEFRDGDTVVFGSESKGISEAITSQFESDRILKIPMMPANRSLNLSNAASIVVYEMWRQIGFQGADFESIAESPYFS